MMLFCFILLLSSQEIDPARFYKENNYSKALEGYLTMLKKDRTNPYLHYNIGNCYYKLNNKEMAISHYIKAFTINPRLQNNISNLKKILRETNNTEIFSDEIPQIFYKIYYFLSDYEIKTSIHALLFLIAILILGWLMNLKNLKKVFLLVTILTGLFSFWYTLRKNSIFYSPAVTLKETDIHSGPSDRFTVLATIPSSKVVMILNDGEEFTEIGILGQNIKGWVKNENIINIKKEL